VVKIELLKSLNYFIHRRSSIAMWNRTAVKSSVRSTRCNRAESRRKGEVMAFRHKLARLSLRDSIHGVARSHEVRLLNELRGSHAASPLRWRGSFWGSFVPLNKLLVGSSLAQNLFL
jgi:hypothetical protein